jgi:predicted secreted hydrolase
MKSMGIWLSVVALIALLSGCNQQKNDKRTVQTLQATSSDGFDSVVKGKALVFPKDHGKHINYRTEWWYITANLTAKGGKRFGLQWTIFRLADRPDLGEKGWGSPQRYMAHIVVSDGEKTWQFERFSRGGIGQAGVDSHPFHAWLDNWSLKSIGNRLFPSLLSFDDVGVKGDFRIHNEGVFVKQGENGYSLKSNEGNQASYYYSAPFLQLSGQLVLDGKTYSVSGSGWFDHEWSTDMLAESQKGWDWFSIHLDDGRALMVSQVRNAKKRGYTFGSLALPNGQYTTLSEKDIQMVPLRYSKVNGKVLPLVWRIDVPKENIRLTVSAWNKKQWLNFRFPYWEGAIIVSGSQKGEGFMELTGY